MTFKLKDGISIGTTNIFDTNANLLVNSPTTTKFATARSINGTSFDGTTDITVTAAAGTLTGTTLNSTVVTSSLTSVGTITTGVWNGSAIGTAYLPTGTSSAKGILQVDGTTIVATAGVISYTLPTSSTTTLGGVKVDGTSISVAAGVITANAGSLAGTTLNSNIITSSLTTVGTLTSLAVGGNSSLTGSLTVGTNATIQGNLTVQGSINYTGTVTQNNITTNNGTFNGDTYGFGAIYAGVTGGTVLDNTIVTMIANKNDLSQINIQNKNIGNQSTAEICATSSNGGQTFGFIDMGIANSAWNGTQSNSLAYAAGPNDGWLYVMGTDGVNALNGGNLIIGTGTSGQVVKFNVGGLATTSGNPTQFLSAVINAPSTTASSTSTGTLVVYGGIGTSGAVYAASATTTGNIAVNGGSLTTSATTANIVNTNATTVNFAGAGTTVSIGASSGTTTVNNNLVVTGTFTVNGNTETINATTIQVADKNIELGKVTTPTDTTADGGGITLKGATDKTLVWDSANTNWSSSEHFNLLTGKSFKINNTSVLSATTLGSGVTTSSLTTVGTIGTGTWQASTIAVSYGGTGATSFTSGALLKGAGTGAITVATASDIVSAIGSTAVSNSNAATNATNIATTGGVNTNAAHYVGYVTSNTSGNYGINTSANLAFNPSTGVLSASQFNGNVQAIQIITTTGSGNAISYRQGIQSTVATTTATSVDSWSATVIRSAKYIVQIKQGTNYSVHEILVIHDGTTTYKTEYGVLETNGALATFTSDILSGNVRLLVTMGSSASATINISRELIAI